MTNIELINTLKGEGIKNSEVLNAMAKVPRELFVSDEYQSLAYQDEALPIECQQTISQPYIVARMTELLLGNKKPKRVLEVGTGSGYQAAILAQIAEEVYTIERIETLYQHAKQRFESLEYRNIHVLYGDGFLGWPSHAPYDGIIVTAGATEIPRTLLEQLAEGGRLVIPVGVAFGFQEIYLVTRNKGKFDIQTYEQVIFVPMLHGKV